MKLLLALGLSAALIGFSVMDAVADPYDYYRGGGTDHGGYHRGDNEHYDRGFFQQIGAFVYGGAIAYPYRHYGYGYSYGYCEINYEGYLYNGSIADDGYCYLYLDGRWVTSGLY